MDGRSYYLEYLKRTTRFPQSVYHKPKHEIVKRLILSLPRGSRVLDAGCGVGHVTGPYCDDRDLLEIDLFQEEMGIYEQARFLGHSF